MVDTNVLLNAMFSAGGVTPDDPERADQLWRSEQLVESAEHVAVSAITWFEARRLLDDEQAAALLKWRGRIEIVAFDARAAERAAELIQVARSERGTMCPRCLGNRRPIVCKVCGNQSSKQQRTHDVLIAATAAVDPRIRTLYSFDGGVADLGRYLEKELEIRVPPSAAKQLPLDVPTPIREGNLPPSKRKTKRK